MINDVRAKQPYREDLIDVQEKSASPSPLRRKRLFLPRCSYDFSDKTAAQIRQERLDYLKNQIQNFNINKDLDQISQVLFHLKGDYSESKDCLVMKKSVFSKLILSRLPIQSR